MTVRKGQLWERPVPTGVLIVELPTLGALHTLLRDSGLPTEPLYVALNDPGSLGKTIRHFGDEQHAFGLDVGVVEMGETKTVLLNAASFTRRMHRDACYVMNGQWLGDFNLGHRAHPNDGRFDIVEWGHLSYWQWRAVANRLGSGAFTPHPAISESRTDVVYREFMQPMHVQIDSIAYPQTKSVQITLRPDAIFVVA